MGEVYQAHDTKLRRDVAIQILPEAFSHDADRLSRFEREAKLLASLNHPNIATIHGLEESNGTHYLVMELVPGDTLQQRVKRDGAVPVEESLTIAKQIAEALPDARGVLNFQCFLSETGEAAAVGSGSASDLHPKHARYFPNPPAAIQSAR